MNKWSETIKKDENRPNLQKKTTLILVNIKKKTTTGEQIPGLGQAHIVCVRFKHVCEH